MNHPDLARAHLAMRAEEAKSFRSARARQRQARAGAARLAVTRRLSRIGRRPAEAPTAS